MNKQTDSSHEKYQQLEPIKIHTPNAQTHDNHYAPRAAIYVREVKGLLETFRRSFGLVMMALFVALPFIQYQGQQAILFDAVQRRLNLFSITLYPDDFSLFAWLLVIAAFALFFVTTFAGRVWCGFLCPQTTWSYIFMWIEKKCEGQRHQRIKLDQRRWDSDKLRRKTSKHALWSAVALLTSLVFIGYFVPIIELFPDFFGGELTFTTYAWIVFFAVCTYGNAGWMREAMCTHICPYARFQSVMFDANTLTVTYDSARGEGRGPRTRKHTREENRENGLGDCIDCHLCVQVCPTGIDIRNGLQYECINCGACVDACNHAMSKMRYPKGLIKYTSEAKLEDPKAPIIRPKLLAYAAALCVLVGLFSLQLEHRSLLKLDVSRDRNVLYRETNQGLIENAYTVSVTNKTQSDLTYWVDIQGIKNYQLIGKSTVTVAAGDNKIWSLSVAINPYELTQMITDIEIVVRAEQNPSIIETQQTTFIYR